MKGKNALADGLKVKRKLFSPVWITPILALCVTVWLLYSGYINTGKEIIIQFDSGSDLSPEKTLVKYKGIAVGKVKDVRIAADPEKVEAVVILAKDASILAKKGMMFWIVRPRLGFNEITGLDTLISGTYIEVLPPLFDEEKLKELPEETKFIGLADPPDVEISEDSLNIHLRTSKNHYVVKGLPIFFKGMNAGQVLSVRYMPELEAYDLTVSIKRGFKQYINDKTLFWDVGRLEIQFDAAGLLIESPPLGSLLTGGISFDTPKDTDGKEIETGHVFHLFSSHKQSMLSENEITINMPSSHGMKGGSTPVMFMGLPAGLVVDVQPSEDFSSVDVKVRMNKRFAHLIGENSKFVLIQPKFSLSGISGVSTILTGVYLEVFPGGSKPTGEFIISEFPPVKGELNGQRLTLLSDTKGNIEERSGILFKNIQIGHVDKISLLANKKIKFTVVIYEEYKPLLNEGLYFKKNQGLAVKVGPDGLAVETPSISTLMNGGIVAEYFGKSGKTSGILYETEIEAKQKYYEDANVKIINFEADNAERISGGENIFYKGIQIGETGKFELGSDGKVHATAIIYPEYENLVGSKSVFYQISGVTLEAGATGIKFQTGTLSTALKGGISLFNADAPVVKQGEYYTIFDNIEDAKKSVMIGEGKLHEITLRAPGVILPRNSSHVYYRNIQAGTVVDSGLNEDGEAEVKLVIYPEFTNFINEKTRFWLEGGIELEASTAGLSVKTKPLRTYMEYAVNFDNIGIDEEKHILFADKNSAEAADMLKIKVTFPYLAEIKNGAPLILGKAEIGKTLSSVFEAGATVTEILVERNFADSLREGSVFWTETLRVSTEGIQNLDSIIFGANIHMLSGKGEPKNEFMALSAPPSPFAGKSGLRLLIKSKAKHSLSAGSPVYYRQMVVGGVESVSLSPDARYVDINIFIEEDYARLVRENSVFWNAGGIGAKVNLFGAKIKTESVKAILEGGISFATPDKKCGEAKEGDTFLLHSEPKEKWAEWQPDLSETKQAD